MSNALPVNINAGFADSTEKYVVLIGKYNFAINGTVYSFTESSMRPAADNRYLASK